MPAGRPDKIVQLLVDLVAAAGRHDEDHGLVLEAGVDDLRRQRGRELLLAGRLRGQGALLLAEGVLLLGQLSTRGLHALDQRVLQVARAEYEADRQRQEDRDDRDEVVAEIDHLKSPVSQKRNACQRSASSGEMTSPAGDTATVTTMVTAAARVSSSSDHIEIRLR